jgi:hypothetical protein
MRLLRPIIHQNISDKYRTAANCRIAGHLADPGGVMGQQQRAGTHPGGRCSRLGPGVPAPDNNDIPVLHGGEI